MQQKSKYSIHKTKTGKVMKRRQIKVEKAKHALIRRPAFFLPPWHLPSRQVSPFSVKTMTACIARVE